MLPKLTNRGHTTSIQDQKEYFQQCPEGAELEATCTFPDAVPPAIPIKKGFTGPGVEGGVDEVDIF